MDAGRLGFAPDTVIQELGWDEDVDDELRQAIESQCGSELVEVTSPTSSTASSSGGATATAISSTPSSTRLQDLAEGGSVWLLTPKVGRSGYVSGADIVEAAPIAGLSTTTTSSASPEWSATKLSTHKR